MGKVYNMNVLISGAAGFLGQNYVKYLLNKKNVIIAIDKNNAALLKLKKEIKNFQNNLYTYQIDITDQRDLKKLELKLKRSKIIIDILINNAAIDSVPKKKGKNLFDVNQLKKEMDVSLVGTCSLIESFKNKMIKQKFGKIINIGSDLSVIAPNQNIYKGIYKNFVKPVSYSLIKHAIVGVTKYYASLLGGTGVTVNMLSPGPIYNNHDKNFVKRLKEIIPENRMGEPSDLFSAIDFLIDKKNKYFTGQNLIVDGGRTVI